MRYLTKSIDHDSFSVEQLSSLGAGMFLCIPKKPNMFLPLYHNTKPRVQTLVVNVVLLLVIILALPVIVPIVVLFQVHRQIVARLLAFRHGSSFRGLLEGADVVWAVQDRSSRAMASVLLLFDKPEHVNDLQAHVDLLRTFRDRFRRHQSDGAYQKMFWQRRLQWGYYFWTQSERPLSADDYIAPLETVPHCGCLSRRQLCALIGSISNRQCDVTSWELLIGSQPVRLHDGSTITRYPVLFRYHHSIADGIAIFRLFCQDILDSATAAEEHVWNPDAVKRLSMKAFLTGPNLLRMAFRGPRFLLNEIFLKNEHNPFCGVAPSEDKIMSWIGEKMDRQPCERPLISVIKKIKRSVVGCSFTDVFLAAFAMSLRAYCERHGVPVPGSITVGRMQRFQRETKEIRLRNRSTAVFKSLPVGNLPIVASSLTTITQLMSLLGAVSGPSRAVQSIADALITHLSVSYLPELLPVPVMRALFARSKFSIALSNIPAFAGTVAVQNYTLQEATFWVPNIESNMFGVTILTTHGRLQIGAVADRKIIAHDDELDLILKNTLEVLQNMGSILMEKEN
uniref:O-acyltransferase WSD1 C-terminal domain-containing protein n=1 Tax=Anopheles dirus TaxID=7168 RepID=A0A182MYV9_9DIPT